MQSAETFARARHFPLLEKQASTMDTRGKSAVYYRITISCHIFAASPPWGVELSRYWDWGTEAPHCWGGHRRTWHRHQRHWSQKLLAHISFLSDHLCQLLETVLWKAVPEPDILESNSIWFFRTYGRTCCLEQTAGQVFRCLVEAQKAFS